MKSSIKNNGKKTLPEWKKFRAWCYYYLLDHFTAKLGKIHDEWFKIAFKHKYICIAAPRGFAKSHIWTFYYVLYKVLTSKKPCHTVIISASESTAVEFLTSIKHELETNQLLQDDYGLQIGNKWSDNHIVLKKGVHIWAKGVNSAIRGTHPRPRLIIGDDVEDPVQVFSISYQEKLNEKLKKDWMYALEYADKSAQLVLIGTKMHNLSFISRMIQKDRDIFADFSKWYLHSFAGLDDKDKSVWEAHRPTKLLHEMRKTDPDGFLQEIMGEPIPVGQRIFKPEYIHYYNKLPPNISCVTVVDPAATTGIRSDYTAIVTLGSDPSGVLYVLEAKKGKWPTSEIIEEIFLTAERYFPTVVAVEAIAFANQILVRLKEEMAARKVYLNAIPLTMDNSSVGKNKLLRIRGLEPWFRDQAILLRENQKDLIAELLTHPGKHDDLIDALAYSVELVTKPNKTNYEYLKRKNAPLNCMALLKDRRLQAERRLRNRYHFYE